MVRKAYTLVELLVVIAIIALIAGLLAFVMPGFQDRSRAAKGGQALQGWMSYARQRALFEQSPRGIRLLFTTKTFQSSPPVTLTTVTEAQYVEQPDDFRGGALYMPDPNKRKEIVFENTNFADGSVEAGDYIEILGSGQAKYITPVDQFNNPIQNPRPSNPALPAVLDMLILASDLPNAIPQTQKVSDYRIQRRPRVAGDEPMAMPTGILIDLTTTTSTFPSGFNPVGIAKFSDPPANTQGHIDIMFGPSGAMIDPVLDRDKTRGKLIFWVRKEPPQAGKDDPFETNPTLIVIQANTGTVSAFNPVAGANPYVNVK